MRLLLVFALCCVEALASLTVVAQNQGDPGGTSASGQYTIKLVSPCVNGSDYVGADSFTISFVSSSLAPAWVSTKSYTDVGTQVLQGGVGYVAIASSTGVTPGTDATKWVVGNFAVALVPTGACPSSGSPGSTWLSGTAYTTGTHVVSNGGVYVALKTSTNVVPGTSAGATYWSLISPWYSVTARRKSGQTWTQKWVVPVSATPVTVDSVVVQTSSVTSLPIVGPAGVSGSTGATGATGSGAPTFSGHGPPILYSSSVNGSTYTDLDLFETYTCLTAAPPCAAGVVDISLAGPGWYDNGGSLGGLPYQPNFWTVGQSFRLQGVDQTTFPFPDNLLAWDLTANAGNNHSAYYPSPYIRLTGKHTNSSGAVDHTGVCYSIVRATPTYPLGAWVLTCGQDVSSPTGINLEVDISTGNVKTPGTISSANPVSTAVNGQTCTLGSTCTVADATKVPTTTTVNGHALSSNVTVTASDVGAAQLIGSFSVAMHTTLITSGNCDVTTATVTGATPGTDGFFWNPSTDITIVTGYIPSTSGGLSLSGWMTTNTVNFKVCNQSASSITPGALTVTGKVIR